MARKRKPKILYVEAPDEGAGEEHAPEQEEKSPKNRRKESRKEKRRRKKEGVESRPAPKVVRVLNQEGKREKEPKKVEREEQQPVPEQENEKPAAESLGPVKEVLQTEKEHDAPEPPQAEEAPLYEETVPEPEDESPVTASPEKPAVKRRDIPDPRIERPLPKYQPRTSKRPPARDPQRKPEPPEKEKEPATPVAPPPTRRRRPNWALSLVFGAIFLSVLAAFIFIPLDKQSPTEEVLARNSNCLGIRPDLQWGYRLDELICEGGIVTDGQDLAGLLLNKRVDYKSVIQLSDGIAGQGLPPIKPGNNYTLMYHPDEPMQPYLMAYAPDPTTYVLLNLKDEPRVAMHRAGVESRETRQMEVAIITNLAEAMFNREFGLDLARRMEAALKWKLDLFHLEPGDRFSLLYDEVTYEGGSKDIERLAAVRYRHQGEEDYAFYYRDSRVNGFFDSEGRPMRSGFLKAPLEYGRISSAYNLRRRDPLSKTGQIRAHLGTDYAAPLGTPILAVADGVVLKAERKGGNGNYVKLFHTKAIQTQYLHMSKFAEGIKPGVEVEQGQVIGYVGQTGRATGPHVCFRYWKDGKQVDHRKEKFLGPSPPLRGTSLEEFNQHRDSLMRLFEPV